MYMRFLKNKEWIILIIALTFALFSLSCVSNGEDTKENNTSTHDIYFEDAVEVGKGIHGNDIDFFIDELASYDLKIENAVNEYISKNSPKYVYPLDGVITSGFDYRTDPIDNESYVLHTGIDIAPSDELYIYAYTDGTVVSAQESDEGYGNHLVLSHGKSFETLYAHCSKLLVSVGDKVMAGDIIAVAGNTGRSTGTHLHFETRVDGAPTDPLVYMKLNGGYR